MEQLPKRMIDMMESCHPSFRDEVQYAWKLIFLKRILPIHQDQVSCPLMKQNVQRENCRNCEWLIGQGNPTGDQISCQPPIM
ncbi:hypothetical protein [Ammoniphilus sp. YIM 78166]|uniref:hypothetical protein n=1 Tax=Ammoniphilus sp. YIM 78166 TaxID=1644106 RepID=UPI0010706316|nr:hypothetical protein [Ammoniphilus sp. YIM 78166]